MSIGYTLLLIVYEFQALHYIHYQHVVVTLDVNKWTYGVAMEFKDLNSVKMHSKHHTK